MKHTGGFMLFKRIEPGQQNGKTYRRRILNIPDNFLESVRPARGR